MNSVAWPTTPRALLEARYKAFVEGQIDFVIESHHPETRGQLDRPSLESWSKNSKWLGLTIEREEAAGEKAYITFTVRYERDFETLSQKERAEFRKEDGKWFYFDSEFPKPESVRIANRVGRNDPCPCGSDKKFKKCCGNQAAA